MSIENTSANNAAVAAGTNGETGAGSGGGRAAILVALILGGALAAGGLILWDAHRTKVMSGRVVQVEEQSRRDIHDAYRELHAERPGAALQLAASAEAKLRDVKAMLPADYVELRREILMLQGECAFELSPRERAAEAEDKFDKALALMTSPSGAVWEKGMFGRARARLEQGKSALAEEDLSKLLEENPNFGAAYYWRSQARAHQGNTQGAAEDAVIARRLGSSPPSRDFAVRRGVGL